MPGIPHLERLPSGRFQISDQIEDMALELDRAGIQPKILLTCRSGPVIQILVPTHAFQRFARNVGKLVGLREPMR